ncbi:MAG: Maf family protein [Verrucomicrobiales bacterium]|nr:Maf family protein [Verrucomicrobiales bacterium]
MQRLILGSQSPRRVDLMRGAGYDYEVIPADVEEAMDASLKPPELTCANAALKAKYVARLHPDALVIGADTLVYLDEAPLGKPSDLEEAIRMVTSLAGRTHQVCTGVALISQKSGVKDTFHVITNVTFKVLTNDEVCAYLSKIDPLDKAGGYAAQEHGNLVLQAVEGSWTNVVGLPMDELGESLVPHGFLPAGAE